MSEIKNKSEEQVVAEVEDHRKDLAPFAVAAERTSDIEKPFACEDLGQMLARLLS